METIEQLKQDNAKLQERLNNAAKFFREQKAQIEALTKENEELRSTPKDEVISTEKWNTLVTEKENLNTLLNDYRLKLQKLESDIDSKDTAYTVLQNTYNEVWAEKEKITKQFKEQEKFESEVINTKVPELETKLSNANAAYEELRKKYSEIKKLHDDDLRRYNELEDNYEGLQNKYKENDIAKGEAELKVETLQAEYEKKFAEQEEQLSIAKNAVEKTVKKFEQLREANNSLQDKSIELTNDVKKYQAQYNDEHLLAEECKKQVNELKDDINKRQEEYNIIIQQLKEAKEDREEFRSKLVELEKEYDKLNELYDNCESEKLSMQSDYNQLEEKIKYIEANNISDKEWQNHLEDLLSKIKDLADINNQKTEHKENIMKRTGDYNVSGENIGV